MWRRFAVLLVFAAAACTSQPAGQTAQHTTSPSPINSSPAPSPAASPTPPPKPAASPTAPANVAVAFTGLGAGVHPAHLHSRCSGAQQFHILVLASVAVGAAGSGTISVPRGYFGRGLCVIVYGSSTLATVVAARRL